MVCYIHGSYHSFEMFLLSYSTSLPESSVVEKHVNAENSSQSPLVREPPESRQSTSSEFSAPQREMLQRMKSITNATDAVCASILKKKNFNLSMSIDSYLGGER